MGLNHLACIMDGNRRWALQQGLLSLFGHRKGFDAVKRVVDFCLEKQIAYLSLYVFSLENLEHRSQDERRYLFEVLAQEALQDFEDFKRKGVRIRFVGDRALFPESVKSLCEKTEIETAGGAALHVNFLLCYGSQQEITDATKRIAVEVAQGNLQPQDITKDVFETFLWTAGTPAPDLVIRTGGQSRLSNFLLFQCAYSELYFLDILWPDITSVELETALTFFDKCRKNFGK